MLALRAASLEENAAVVVRDESTGDRQGARDTRKNDIEPARKLVGMTAEQLISFARGAPSLDIVDVAGLKAAAARAFDADPAGVTAYGTSVGYIPLRKWIAEKHGVSARSEERRVGKEGECLRSAVLVMDEWRSV